ncbi:unnamed protein product [Cylindrotheca closterium]|uniref:Bicarbonate transporter-like transmembrane domain-containing protein n=1 Tax=Cylindrotheca closterium TaxID=2856 RepID=A0AAD2CE22_9STRA|nr:unnamed protein product [Cylindrotheca closterium]CAJ1924420.1 unnamed protein product [Cylindrotheca closterium]
MPGFSYRQPNARTNPTEVRDGSGRTIDDDSSASGNDAVSKTFGRGIVQDFKRTIGTWWFKEMTNFNTKTVAVSFFLFIAVIAPTITFGAVYAKATNNYIGAVELLLATAWCGIFYSLVSGQPMMINGGTGPVLTFQTVCYDIAKNLDVPFLTFNAWIGIWVCIYQVLAAFFDANRLIKKATRFTDETFALLIVSIFLLGAIGNPSSKVGLFHYFGTDHPHHENMIEENGSEYDYMTVALLSLILGLGTAFFAIGLRQIKFSAFCCNDYVRTVITDFAITISVVVMTALRHTVFEDVQVEELKVPDTFATSFSCCTADCTSYWPTECPDQAEAWGRRPWVVDLFDLNDKIYVIFIAAGLGIPAFILTFLDNGITWHIVNHPSNRLSHGDAYNYDTCISAIMVLVNSLLGLPWLVASTVPCIMHITAMQEKNTKGEVKYIQESRLTGLFTHTLVLACIFALSVIRLIPLPVLYGVFLFMGLVALPGQQFWQRFLLFFQQPTKMDKNHYTKNVPVERIHKYTLVQFFFFAVVCVVREIKAISIAFPVMVLLCIPARLYLHPRLFSKDELILLDGSPEEIEDWLLKNDPEEMAADKAQKSAQAQHVADNGLALPAQLDDEDDEQEA